VDDVNKKFKRSISLDFEIGDDFEEESTAVEEDERFKIKM
jgi:hypothetical protein